MDLKPGSRWRSAVCTAEFVIVRPPKAGGELQCGGQAVLPHGATATAGAAPAAGLDTGVAMGKRYTDADSGIEVLCAKAGAGALAFDGRPLVQKDAKPLPASD